MYTFLLLAALLIALPVQAEEITGTTASGAGIVQSGSGTQTDSTQQLLSQISAMREDLAIWIPERKETLLASKEKLQSFATETDRFLKQSRLARQECHDAMRRANRDTLLRTITVCLRAELLEEMQFLRKEEQYVGLLPLLTESVRADATKYIRELIDAQMTVINAIDAGVYLDREGVQESRVKLRDRYRSPYWLAMTHVRAERELTWVGLIVKRIESLLHAGLQDPAGLPRLSEAISCLDSGRVMLRTSLEATEPSLALEQLQEAKTNLSACDDPLRAVLRLERKRQAAAKTEKGTE